MLHRHGGDIYTYGKVYDFSANINFRGMPEPVRSAAVQAVDASVHYPDPEYRTLRRALAGREGIAQTDHMICGNGAAELMFALSAAYRPKNALLAAPSFFEYEQALASSGCAVRRFCLKKEDGFAKITNSDKNKVLLLKTLFNTFKENLLIKRRINH